jgi:DNA-binding NarL/FixJ family response regulator
MERLLKILALEDRDANFELCKRHVLKHYPNAMFTRASNETEFLEKLGWSSYDLVIADYHLPGYNGLTALLHVKEHHPGLPFIFLTGNLRSEEESANAILRGANGYVLKDNLHKLHEHVSTVLTAVAENKALLEKVKSVENERRLKLQKAIGLLEQAADFPARNQIIDLLKSDLLTKPLKNVNRYSAGE